MKNKLEAIYVVLIVMLGVLLLAFSYLPQQEDAEALTIEDCNFEESEAEVLEIDINDPRMRNDILWEETEYYDILICFEGGEIQLTLGMDSLADPFTIVIDDVERQFTHKEFKRRLGFVEEPNDVNVNETSDTPKEGQLRWIRDTFWRKGHLDFYDGSQWINLDEAREPNDVDDVDITGGSHEAYMESLKSEVLEYEHPGSVLFYKRLATIEERLANLERFLRYDASADELVLGLEEPNDEDFEYQATNGIPICPYCRKPTKRTGGVGSATLMYFRPIYNEKGENTVADKNIFTTEWQCCKCGKDYVTSGNPIEGFRYIHNEEPNGIDDKVFCITEFDEGSIQSVEYLSPDDPCCLITVDDFLLKAISAW